MLRVRSSTGRMPPHHRVLVFSPPSHSGCVQRVEDHVYSTCGNVHGSLVCEPTHNAETAECLSLLG